MPEPIHVENTFQELTRELELVSSIRHRYSLIRDFIYTLDGRYSTFDSYLIQICSELPVYTSPITYSGMDPNVLEEDVNLFQKLAESVPELSEIMPFQKVLSSLKRICIIQYGTAGASNQIERLLIDWYGIQISMKSKDALTTAISTPGRIRLNMIQSSLREYLNENEKSLKSQDQELILLFRELKEFYSNNENSVLIPVVERYSDLSDKKSIYGRLRKLSVNVTAEINQEKDQITRRFNIIGIEQPVWLDESLVAEAARFMLKEEGHVLEHRSFSGEIHYELSGAIHEGNSANAAISALWFTGLQRFLNLRKRFELKPDIAMTGDVDGKGNILAVDDEGIKKKIEAVFFSGIDYFVVPKVQLQRFNIALQNLNHRFPNRKLNLFGAENIREIFYDRRLSDQIYPSKLSFVLKQAWQKKFETAGIVTILVMLGIIFRLIYGPLDQNPVLYSFAGEVLHIKNQSEVKLETISVGTYTVHRSDNRPQTNFVVFHDITGNGSEDIVWAEIEESENFRSTTLNSKILGGNEFIWQQPLRFNLDFPEKPFVTERDYYPAKLSVVEGQNNNPKLVISADHIRYFPGILSVRDLNTGEELSHFINTGRIQDFEITDLNSDGSLEIIFCGINNAFNMAFLAILSLDEIHGHSPLTDEYRVDGYEINKNIKYVLIPKTVIGQSVTTHRSYNVAEAITLRREENVIQVNVTDFHQYQGSNVELPASSAYLLYNFDLDLNLIGVGTSDGYDLTSNFLYTNGMIDEYPDYRYFESYGEKLLYWDGEGFVGFDDYQNGVD